MTASYEYRVVPAPTRGLKGKGVKGADERFAFAFEELMNEMARDGWEYQRAETMPSEERQGLTQVTSVYRNILIFRRPRPSDPAPFQPRLLESQDDAPATPPAPDGDRTPATPAPSPVAQAEDEDDRHDRGVGADTGLAETLRRRAATLLGGGSSGDAPATDTASSPAADR